jgi:acetyl/propionyl-CoA carboxylase alpha subunit
VHAPRRHCRDPATDGPDALDLLDVDAVVAAALMPAPTRSTRASGSWPRSPRSPRRSSPQDPLGRAAADAIRAMGDKAAAATRRDARRPVLAGYDARTSRTTRSPSGRRIGFPLLVKPRRRRRQGHAHVACRDRSPMRSARPARGAAAFGDDRLILERLVEGAAPRRGPGPVRRARQRRPPRRARLLDPAAPPEDPRGDAVAGRRRRPAARLGDAPALAGAVGYVSAGTCEFLLDDRGEPVFLEMNTRLQVEHPVTELVTGRDLVADQLRIAAGEPLDVAQAASTAPGHAVEVRLYAEDAEDGFLPATGRIERSRWPAGRAIRVDAGIDGHEVGGRFDPMLAKVDRPRPDRARRSTG